MSNVNLGIRVRPFSERELRSEKDRIPVIHVLNENTVTITNIKVNVSGAGDSRERVRRYFADYTFDSSCPATQLDYASQEKIFETFGLEVLQSIKRGCSACVLTYGQSATGKTHTMMGTEADPGLVPRLCTALAQLQPLDLTVSFLEIYNERVRDLLAGEVPTATCHSLPRRRGNARKDLRVREHPAKGPYVQNLRRVAVHDVDNLLALVKEGARRRRTAATRRNSTSSRSHALLELTTSKATLHLADLAGSEKASWEGCGGGRQKEGANINKSLVALSNVISALVTGGGRRFVPYRDSALTWLLKDCFTGGASTFIIATVSPSVACYGESASTLRWAARARQLPTPRITNTNSNTITKSALQAQYDQLLAELTRNYIRYVPETGKIYYDARHWSLNINDQKYDMIKDCNKITKIGNIMELLNPKTDAQSESTASSVASGSSDVINTMDKNIEIANEIRKEVDKLFVPTFERTNSSSDLKVIAPLRHKRRQYRSQEVLPVDETQRPNFRGGLVNALPSQSEDQINNIKKESIDKNKNVQTPILYDSQRAEIVASVTERLYSKLKRKEEAAVCKMESIVDKKIMEPLSELRICTNARQRLIDLSHKTRSRRRIGIPAYTQTRISVTRVRDQAIDVQADLEAYVYRNRHFYALQKDAATETDPMTPRCKEVAVGSKYGTLHLNDTATSTDSKQVVHTSSLVMTDIVSKCHRFTQTEVLPPPRRKKRVSSFSKYLKHVENKKSCVEECIATPIININISQTYPKESRTSDNNPEEVSHENEDIPKVTMTPDLLTNHSSTDVHAGALNQVLPSNNANKDIYNEIKTTNGREEASPISQKNVCEDFPDTDDYSLPKVTINSLKTTHQNEMKNMILGRNADVYPYNIILSPPRERDISKRMVKFKDIDNPSFISVASQTSLEGDKESNVSYMSNSCSDNILNSDREYNSYKASEQYTLSESTDSSKNDSNSFIWKNGATYNKDMTNLRRNYIPTYKSTSRYRSAKAKFYKEFLGLEEDSSDIYNDKYSHIKCSQRLSSSDSSNYQDAQLKYKLRNTFFEEDISDDYNCELEKIEQEILDSCDRLEKTANEYEDYISSFYCRSRKSSHEEVYIRTPTEYLQHLVQLRREVVKADHDTNSSLGDSHK